MRPQDSISPEDTLGQIPVCMPRQQLLRPSQQGGCGTTVVDSFEFLRLPVPVTYSPKYEQCQRLSWKEPEVGPACWRLPASGQDISVCKGQGALVSWSSRGLLCRTYRLKSQPSKGHRALCGATLSAQLISPHALLADGGQKRPFSSFKSDCFFPIALWLGCTYKSRVNIWMCLHAQESESVPA